MGAQLVKEVATKTNDVAGDGTTTATLLSSGACSVEGLKNVAAGANPMIVKKGYPRRLLTRLLTKLLENSKASSTVKNDIARVASISAA